MDSSSITSSPMNKHYHALSPQMAGQDQMPHHNTNPGHEDQASYFNESHAPSSNGEANQVRAATRTVAELQQQILALESELAEHRKTEEALRLSQEQLRHAMQEAEEANRAKTNFLANMSHEIRTPLGAILGFSELLRDPSLPEADRQRFLTVILRNGQELASLIDDILDLSKVEAGHLDIKLQALSLAPLLADVTSSFAVKAQEKGIVLASNITPNIPKTIVSDPTRLRQVLINIIGNAVKFTEAGHVHISVELVSPCPDGQIKVAFVISDTGCGIPAAEKAKLFKPFSQADHAIAKKHGGTGLGLALSQKLARNLGGDVILKDSTPGKGSTFVVMIAGGRVGDKSTTRHHSIDPQARFISSHASLLTGTRVLIAEDAPDNQLLLQHMLMGNGAQVELVDDGAQAVAKALSDHYDVILMDMQMPIMDGLTATRALRQQGYPGPIIALTAHAFLDEKTKCLHAGCDDHLTKPISFPHLLETIVHYAGRGEKKGFLRL